MKFLFIALFFVSCASSHSTKYRVSDLVKVKKGFYQDCVGQLLGYDSDKKTFGTKIICENKLFGVLQGMADLKEDQLEKVDPSEIPLQREREPVLGPKEF